MNYASTLNTSGRGISMPRFPVRRMLVWALVLIPSVVIIFCAIVVVMVFHKIPPPVVRVDPQAAFRLQADLRQLELAQGSGAPKISQVDEAELNSYLQVLLSRNQGQINQDERVEDLRIKLQGDILRFYAAYISQGKELTFSVATRLHTMNGYVAFDPVDAKVGALPLPQAALRAALQRSMQSAKFQERMRLPPNLKDIQIQDSHIVITYK
jgi:hypothetical protein